MWTESVWTSSSQLNGLDLFQAFNCHKAINVANNFAESTFLRFTSWKTPVWFPRQLLRITGTQRGISLVIILGRITTLFKVMFRMECHICSNPDSIFSLRLCWVFPSWNCRSLAEPGGGRSQTAKQGLHKPDLTYFVKRLKCKLTENVFSPHHLLPALWPRPIRRLPVLSHHCEVRKGRRLKFPLSQEPSRGSTKFVLGFNEWHLTSVRCSRPPHGGCPHYYSSPNPALL